MQETDDKVIPITRASDRELEKIGEYWKNQFRPASTAIDSDNLFGVSPATYDAWKSETSNPQPLSLTRMSALFRITAGLPLLRVAKPEKDE